jgi:hypothetical protein
MEGLTWGNPMALWGLLLAALPLYAHFSKLIRPKRIVFSDTRLLREVWESQEKRSEPRQRILLALRLLSLLLGVLFLAQPQWGASKSSDPYMWYLDASASMELPYDEKVSRMDEAKRRMKLALEELPRNQTVEVHSEFFPLGRVSRTAEEWLTQLDSIQPTGESDRSKALISNCSLAFSDTEWREPLDEDSPRIESVGSTVETVSWPDSAWIEPHPSGGNRWRGYVQFSPTKNPTLSQRLEWWCAGKRVQWSSFRAVPNQSATVQTEFTAPEGGNCPVELRFSHGGRRHFWIPANTGKQILYLGWVPSGNKPPWALAPTPHEAVVKSSLGAKDLDPKGTALVVVRDWEALPAVEKQALRTASNQGIGILGCNRGIQGRTAQPMNQIAPKSPFYEGMVARMPTALQAVEMENGPLPDSLRGANHDVLLKNNAEAAMSHRLQSNLFWLSDPWDAATDSKLHQSPYPFAWVRRMSEWGSRSQRTAQNDRGFIKNAAAESNWYQNGRIWNSSTRSQPLLPGFLWQSTPNGDTLNVVALHPSRRETGSSRPSPQVENSQGNAPTQSPTAATGNASFFGAPFWWLLLAGFVLATESYFARKSVPLTP